MLTMLNPKGLPQSPAYSQGTLAEAPKKMLFVAGQVGVGPDGQVGSGIAEQAKFADRQSERRAGRGRHGQSQHRQGHHLPDR